MRLFSLFFLIGLLSLVFGCNEADPDARSGVTSDSLSTAQVNEVGNATSSLSSIGQQSLSLIASQDEQLLGFAGVNLRDLRDLSDEMRFYSKDPKAVQWQWVRNPAYWEALDDEPGSTTFSALESCDITDSTSGNTSTVTITCTSLTEETSTCGETTYTFTDLTLSLSLSFNSSTSVFGLTFDVESTIDGGDFSGDDLDCNFTMSIDIGETDIDSAATLTTCACSLNSESIGCDDLESEWEDSSCNSFDS